MKKRIVLGFVGISLASSVLAAGLPTDTSVTNAPFNVSININAAKTEGELTPIWRFFGADEPNYAYMKNGQKLLGELGSLGEPQVYFRAHHLLTSGDGSYALKWGSSSAYKEDAKGKPIYDFSINDRIFDTYRDHNIRPYVEIGFMPVERRDSVAMSRLRLAECARGFATVPRRNASL